ncbi:MAG: YbjQ family protein [Desulfovibrio sp.]|nr:MAG: YbjQ family protein [Desulfovibrio sp.]
MAEFYIKFGIFLFLVVMGYVAGSIIESRHYRSIREREAENLDQPIVTFLKNTGESDGITSSRLVMGNSVVSIDYFKKFLFSLINFFGGRVTSYESLVDRARREAVLRMQEQAYSDDIIVNVRIETSSISKGRRNVVGSVEALAYGTALRYKT